MFRRLCILLVVVGLLTAVPNVWAHKFYTSLAEVNYNPDVKSVEVSLEVFSDDLEKALSQRTGTKVSLEKTADIDKLIIAYLQETMPLRSKNAPVKWQWVGKEIANETTWLYFEAPLADGPDGVTLRDAVFFEVYESQVNLVTGHMGADKLDLAFKSGDGFKPLLKTE